MTKNIVISFFIVLLINPAALANVEITDQDIISDLVKLQSEMDSISSAVMTCMDSGKKHKFCMCENESKFIHFTKTVEEIFSKHPSLMGHDLIHYKVSDGTINNQSLVGIKRQADMDLPCRN